MAKGNYCTKCQTHEGGDYNAPENERYYSTCGTELIEKPPVQKCPSCGEMVKPYAKFCTYCGEKLE